MQTTIEGRGGEHILAEARRLVFDGLGLMFVSASMCVYYLSVLYLATSRITAPMASMDIVHKQCPSVDVSRTEESVKLPYASLQEYRCMVDTGTTSSGSMIFGLLSSGASHIGIVWVYLHTFSYSRARVRGAIKILVIDVIVLYSVSMYGCFYANFARNITFFNYFAVLMALLFMERKVSTTPKGYGSLLLLMFVIGSPSLVCIISKTVIFSFSTFDVIASTGFAMVNGFLSLAAERCMHAVRKWWWKEPIAGETILILVNCFTQLVQIPCTIARATSIFSQVAGSALVAILSSSFSLCIGMWRVEQAIAHQILPHDTHEGAFELSSPLNKVKPAVLRSETQEAEQQKEKQLKACKHSFLVQGGRNHSVHPEPVPCRQSDGSSPSSSPTGRSSSLLVTDVSSKTLRHPSLPSATLTPITYISLPVDAAKFRRSSSKAHSTEAGEEQKKGEDERDARRTKGEINERRAKEENPHGNSFLFVCQELELKKSAMLVLYISSVCASGLCIPLFVFRSVILRTMYVNECYSSGQSQSSPENAGGAGGVSPEYLSIIEAIKSKFVLEALVCCVIMLFLYVCSLVALDYKLQIGLLKLWRQKRRAYMKATGFILLFFVPFTQMTLLYQVLEAASC